MKSKAQDLIVCGHFKLIRKLGTGAFGEIFLAENKNNPSEKCAAKLQQVNTKFPQLYYEAKMYKYLNSSGNVIGIPKVYDIKTQGQYNVMLMDLLGTSVQDIFVDNNKIMSLKSALMIGYQMLERMEYLHERQIIHRDIKPDNFLLGLNSNAHVLYIVDFGLNKHIPYKQGKQLTGTARYASINTHMGVQQSRRDDIQSIGYVVMYLLRGILPWQNMKAKDTKTKYKMIMQKKIATPAQVLCKGYPQELATFINYARNIGFQDKPDYAYLKNLIKSAMKNNNIQMDYQYDWAKKTQKKIQEGKNNQKIQEIILENTKKQSLNEQKLKVQQYKQKQRILASSTQMKNPTTNKNKTATVATNLNSSTNGVKVQQQNVGMKANLDSILSSQKMMAPKINTIKR